MLPFVMENNKTAIDVFIKHLEDLQILYNQLKEHSSDELRQQIFEKLESAHLVLKECLSEQGITPANVNKQDKNK